MKLAKLFSLLFVTFIFSALLAQSGGCSGCKDTSCDSAPKPEITFIELGSVNCIPCKKMQPVMESVEKKYGSQLKVVFYDVWKEDQKKYAEKYKVKIIPTQVFLDKNGKEIHRHEGFYPEKEIDKFLESKGLKPVPKVNK